MKYNLLKIIVAAATFVLICGILCFFFFIGLNKPPSVTNSSSGLTTAVPKAESPGPVFSYFGPGNSYLPGPGWAAGTCAHGEAFVPARTGTLSVLEIAIEPDDARAGSVSHAGDATVSVAVDKNGFPGAVLEQFRVTAGAATQSKSPVVLKSITRPLLQAGGRYWLCARSAGGWVWHDNPREIIQASACEQEPGKWVPGGAGRDGAFSITTTAELERASQ
jgi:hypothetical protein